MKEIIDFKDFLKLDIRIGLISKAQYIENSDKLLLLSVDVGEEDERQLVAGIGKSYDPEELKGKMVSVLVNLEPKKIMGYESQGMVMAADGENGPVVLSPQKKVSVGSIVS